MNSYCRNLDLALATRERSKPAGSLRSSAGLHCLPLPWRQGVAVVPVATLVVEEAAVEMSAETATAAHAATT